MNEQSLKAVHYIADKATRDENGQYRSACGVPAYWHGKEDLKPEDERGVHLRSFATCQPCLENSHYRFGL